MVKDHERNQIEECQDFRMVTRWFQEENDVRLSRPRTVHQIFHHSLNHRDATERLKDVTAWILRHSRDVFDHFTCWQAELVRFLLGSLHTRKKSGFHHKLTSSSGDESWTLFVEVLQQRLHKSVKTC